MSQVNVPTPASPPRKNVLVDRPSDGAAPRRSRAAAAVQAELARAREALEDKSAQLAAALAVTRATLESTADGILVTDDAGRITACNEKFLQIWGFERHEVENALHVELGRRANEALRDPEPATRRLAEIHAAPPEGETLDRVDMADGRVLERFSSEQRIDGRRVGRVWSYRDISARLQAEEALRDEAGVLHFLNRTGATIAATLDIGTLLQTVIDAATQVSGAAFGAFFYRDDPAPGAAQGGDAGPVPRLALAGVRRWPGAATPSPRAAAPFDAAWCDDRTVRCADVTAESRHPAAAACFGLAGDHAPLRSFLALPVTLHDGATVGGLFFGHPEVGVFTERTERIVAGLAAHAAIALDNARLVEGMRRVAAERERLVDAERAARAEAVLAAQLKDDFLSTLSHELRTPLTAILGWAKVLMLQRADAGKQQRGLEAIARNAGAQAALIEDLLEMSRIVSGKVRLDLRPTDLARVVDAARVSVQASAGAKKIALECRVDPAACALHADPVRLQQVVANLLSNAIKFTPANGRVEVGAALVDGQVELTVSDTGCGIAPEFLAHVFDRFRQADSSTTRRHGGLGLGLAIVRQLVALHGGAVSARSAGLGQGAQFIVRLPRGQAAGGVRRRVRRRRPARAAPAGGRRRHRRARADRAAAARVRCRGAAGGRRGRGAARVRARGARRAAQRHRHARARRLRADPRHPRAGRGARRHGAGGRAHRVRPGRGSGPGDVVGLPGPCRQADPAGRAGAHGGATGGTTRRELRPRAATAVAAAAAARRAGPACRRAARPGPRAAACRRRPSA
jgi:PAS domain S-box-containing protein